MGSERPARPGATPSDREAAAKLLEASQQRAREARQREKTGQDEGRIRPEDDPALRAIHERLAGKGRVSGVPERRDSGPVAKEQLEAEPIGKVAADIEPSALDAFVGEIMSNPDAVGTLGEFARALQATEGQQDREAPRPSVDVSKAKQAPNALRLLMQLGGKRDSAPGEAAKKRDTAMLVTRAFGELSEDSQEEIRKILNKKRRLSPKPKENPDRKTG